MLKKNVALVLAGLLMGAGVGALATGRVRAQGLPHASIPRWEQDCDAVRGVDEARVLARVRGETGWELVALDAGVMCFKRPMPAPAKAPEPWPGY